MTITAKVIAHSRHPGCPDLYTVQARYPRFVHAEAKTHRLLRIDDAEYEALHEISLMDDPNLCRNASSSRAIPVERMIQDVLDDPALPVSWGKNQKGMQAGEDLTEAEREQAIARWLEARDDAVRHARAMVGLGLHKQVANRILEPFGHISVVITATEWDNFFALRRHPAADPTMRALADAIHAAMQASVPALLNEGDWHLPYVRIVESPLVEAPMLSAARSARVSYLNHDGTNPDPRRDLQLAEVLEREVHLSPFEHPATPAPGEQHGPLKGWKHLRSILETTT